jgi:hypothetical protein
MHFATHGKTAAELIMDRAAHHKDHMGLNTWKKAPDGKILKSDVVIAKNYLDDVRWQIIYYSASWKQNKNMSMAKGICDGRLGTMVC